MHLVVATPAFAGQISAEFSMSVRALDRTCGRTTWSRVSEVYLGNESLVNRARNTIAHVFMAGPGTHLLMADADLSFPAASVVSMLEYMQSHDDVGVIGAPVPLKGIDWISIRQAAFAGVPADKLSDYGGVFPDYGYVRDRRDGFSEIERIGGFLLIKRSVFEHLRPLLPRYRNNCPGGSIPLGDEVTEYFPTHVVNGELLSEDHGFCHAWRQHGGKIWIAENARVEHAGTFRFCGRYDCWDQRLQTKPESAEMAAG